MHEISIEVLTFSLQMLLLVISFVFRRIAWSFLFEESFDFLKDVSTYLIMWSLILWSVINLSQKSPDLVRVYKKHNVRIIYMFTFVILLLVFFKGAFSDSLCKACKNYIVKIWRNTIPLNVNLKVNGENKKSISNPGHGYHYFPAQSKETRNWQ